MKMNSSRSKFWESRSGKAEAPRKENRFIASEYSQIFFLTLSKMTKMPFCSLNFHFLLYFHVVYRSCFHFFFFFVSHLLSFQSRATSASIWYNQRNFKTNHCDGSEVPYKLKGISKHRQKKNLRSKTGFFVDMKSDRKKNKKGGHIVEIGAVIEWLVCNSQLLCHWITTNRRSVGEQTQVC